MQTSHGCPKCQVECIIFQFYTLIFACMDETMSLCIELQISLEFWWHETVVWFCFTFSNEVISRSWKQVVNAPWCIILRPNSDDKQNFFWSMEEFSSEISKTSFSLTESWKIINYEFVSRFWMLLLPRETWSVW